MRCIQGAMSFSPTGKKEDMPIDKENINTNAHLLLELY
jgi:hypothetical protein